ncbi:MAG TPA: pyridine nucleotide-disulfide oxidoreductase [Spirochaeta sp.]|nr:pyridine nucleotide-disulfide oxidoreductase [Spirochaeta sp.]
MKYVVIGGDAAGMSAASRLKRREPDADVVVYERTGDVSYSACGMPYNIADKDRPIASLVVRSADAFRNAQGIDLHTGHKIEKIDKAAKKIYGKTDAGDDFESSYDKLLIATGASAIRPDVPGADLENVFVLKDLEDSRIIKGYLAENTVEKAVIVGMGYIALEMADALTARGIAVTMVKKREQLLPWMIPELSKVVRKELEAKGVELNPGFPLESVEKTSSGLVVNAGGSRFDCDMVLFAIGVKPESKLAADAGLELGAAGAVSIDKTMRTTDADIFAAGDCADALSIVSGQKVWLPLALTANRGGRLAADNMLDDEQLFNGIAGTGVFKVFDIEVARTGLSVEEAETAGFEPVYKAIVAKSKAHVFPDAAPLHASFIADRASGKILGAQMVGTEGVARRINAAAVALQAGMTLGEFYECDLAYAPPFSPVWDPLLTAASLLMKKTGK